MNAVVTIVLPVHNAERSIRSSLLQILELAESPKRQLQVAIVDDGSTDATYEIACEAASEYPQICVLRQPCQRGLGAAFELVRSRLGVVDVIAHDGVSPIDHQELAALLAKTGERRLDAPAISTASPIDAHGEGRGTRRFSTSTTISSRLAEANRWGSSFRWLRIDEPTPPRRKRPATPVLATTLDGLTPMATTVGNALSGSW